MRGRVCFAFILLTLLLLLLAGCGGPTEGPIASSLPTLMVSPSLFPSPRPTTTPLPWNTRPSATRLTPTQPPTPSPTETPRPTLPIDCPVLPTATPLPAEVSAVDLLPPGAEFVADAVADVGEGGQEAAVIVYRSLGGDVSGATAHQKEYFIDSGGLQVLVQSLDGATYRPQAPAVDSPITLAVVDLNGDGLREAVTMPSHRGTIRFAHSGLASWPYFISANPLLFKGGHLDNYYPGCYPPAGYIFSYPYAGFVLGQCPLLYLDGPKEVTMADVDYVFHYPGELAFRWNGEAYEPAYLLQQGQLLPLRPRLPLFFAPYASLPIDQDIGSWRQIDYWNWTTWCGSSECTWPGVPVVPVWDQDTLSIGTYMAPTDTVILALDGDLLGDFDERQLSDDGSICE